MPIPSSINDLDTNPNNNSPQGSETVGPNASGYLQALSAFIKQLANGVGILPTAAVNMNGQKLTGLSDGTISSTSTDAVTGKQIRALNRIGEVRMYHGAVANIPAVWGSGWQLCDGTNGTANLTDSFIVGAGSTYSPNATGGNNSIALTTAQLPSHAHAITDPGHSHGIADPAHNHGITDNGHGHSFNRGSMGAGAPIGSGWADPDYGGPISNGVDAAHTGITINNAATGIAIKNSATGITTTQSIGTGAAIDIRPKYYALCFIEYVGP